MAISQEFSLMLALNDIHRMKKQRESAKTPTTMKKRRKLCMALQCNVLPTPLRLSWSSDVNEMGLR